VNSASDPCCTLHEWLVLPLRDCTEFYADAAFSTLRAHAAGKPNSHNGLEAAISCIAERKMCLVSKVTATLRTKPTLTVLEPMAAFAKMGIQPAEIYTFQKRSFWGG